MNVPTRFAHVTIALAAISLTAILLGYLLTPVAGRSREIVADAGLTWTAAYAALCCLLAARALRSRPAGERGMWRWLAAGCAVWLLGQLAWDYTELLGGLTVAALAYRSFLLPLQRSAVGAAAVLTSIGWAAGGIAMVWLLLRETGVPSLAKPFRFEELERVIRRVAARHARGEEVA